MRSFKGGFDQVMGEIWTLDQPLGWWKTKWAAECQRDFQQGMEDGRMYSLNGVIGKICLLLSLYLASPEVMAQTQSPFFNDSDNINVLGRWSSVDAPSNAGAIDYNGDGFKDMFISFRGSERGGEVLMGNTIQGHRPIFHSNVPNIFEGPGINPGCTGIIFADIDNDGYSDFYAPNVGGHQLFKFTPSTGKYEDIASSISTPGGFDSIISGSWGDFNGDGWVDLLLLKYSGTTLTGQTFSSEQRLLVNDNGQGFSLKDVVDTGIDNVTAGIVSALWCDFSGDGYVDLALIEGGGAAGNTTKYFQNVYDLNAMGRRMAFLETPAMNSSYYELTWPGTTAVAADANNDGALDVLFHSTNRFGALLTDTSDPENYLPFTINNSNEMGSNPTTWNIGALDFNLDGNMDFIGVRYTNKKTSVFFNSPNQTGPFHLNDWSEEFSGTGQDDRGLCLADFSDDGYTDVFLSRPQYGLGYNNFYWTGRPQDFLYRDWIGVQLHAPGTNPQPGDLWYCNYDCIGATVTVHAGDHVQAQTVDGGSGRARQGDRALIFGLGDFESETIDFIEVSLPNGQHMQFFDLAVNETHKIPVNGVELVTGSMGFVIEQNEDNTQDWIVTWSTDGITDSSKDRVIFAVGNGDAIETFENGNVISHGPSVDLMGVGTVAQAGSQYSHTVRLDNVICEGNRKIYCQLWSSSGAFTIDHVFPSKKTQYCLMSN